MYKLEYNIMDGNVGSIRRLSDNSSIPLSEGNIDYQEFLKWNSAQATPLDMASKSQDVLANIAAAQAKTAKKKQDIDKNLATWKELSDDIAAANDVKKLQDVVARLAKVIYWLAKDQEK